MTGSPRVDWYPGLMARTKRFLGQHASSLDVCLEVVDARAPDASRWHGLRAMLPSMPRILLLNKADLADPSVSSAWIKYLRQQDEAIAGVFAIDATSGSGRTASIVRSAITAAVTRPPGAKRPVKVAAVGVPNVGKSSILNMVSGRRRAPAGAKPGLTRGEHWLVITPTLWLLDLPGVLPAVTRDTADVIRLAAIGTLPDGSYEQVDVANGLLESIIAEVGAGRLAESLGLPPQTVEDWLEAFGRRRGFLLPGGGVDISRSAAVVMAEFRRGAIGRISLEHPPSDLEAPPDERV